MEHFVLCLSLFCIFSVSIATNSRRARQLAGGFQDISESDLTENSHGVFDEVQVKCEHKEKVYRYRYTKQ